MSSAADDVLRRWHDAVGATSGRRDTSIARYETPEQVPPA